MNKRPSRHKSARTAKTLNFVYGRISTADDRLHVAFRPGLERGLAARGATTWGEYARACGMSWKDMLDGWGSEIRALTGAKRPARGLPFSFSSVLGYYVSDAFRDPRDAAYEVIWDATRGRRDDPRLSGLEWSAGTPAGHPSCITSADESDVHALGTLLNEARATRYVFERDDAIMNRMFGW
jgi:hypothetical protein